MVSGTAKFLAGIVEKAKKALRGEPKTREEFVEQTADELVKRFHRGQVGVGEIEKWTDRLNVSETELIANLVYSQLVIKATFKTRSFDEAIIKGGFRGRNAGYRGATSGVTDMEESLTDFFLPKFIENWSEESKDAIRLFERAEDLASEYLDEKKEKVVAREKNRFEEQLELIEEISELSRSFEDEELAEERQEIYKLDRNIKTRLESSTPSGMMEGFGGPKSVPADEESEARLKKRNELLHRRKEKTPEEVRRKIHSRYEKLKSIIEDSQDIRDDIRILKKEEVL